jgi:hypothetical protein
MSIGKFIALTIAATLFGILLGDYAARMLILIGGL